MVHNIVATRESDFSAKHLLYGRLAKSALSRTPAGGDDRQLPESFLFEILFIREKGLVGKRQRIQVLYLFHLRIDKYLIIHIPESNPSDGSQIRTIMQRFHDQGEGDLRFTNTDYIRTHLLQGLFRKNASMRPS